MEDSARDDAAYLKSLRQDARLDLAELAALANLSAGQIRQLEDGGESLFYSPQIKAQSLRRLIQLLEAPQPSGKPTKVQPAETAPRSSANVIEDIIRLSEKNLKGNVVSTPVRRPVNTAWMFTLLVLVFVCGGCYLYWLSNRDIPQSVFNEWVQPLTRGSDAASPAPVNAIANNPLPASSASQNTTSTTVVSSAATVTTPSSAPAVPTTPAAVAVAVDLPPATAVAQPKAPPVTAAAPVAISPPIEKTKALTASLPETATTERKTTNSPQDNALASDKASDCFSIQSEAQAANAVSPNKAATYVYIQASKPVQICVEDGQKHRTVVSLDANLGRSIHGTPPWTLASRELKSVQIYFQGSKVWLPTQVDKRIVLNAQPIAP